MPLMKTARLDISTLAVISHAQRQNEGQTSRTASTRQVEITTTQYRERYLLNLFSHVLMSFCLPSALHTVVISLSVLSETI